MILGGLMMSTFSNNIHFWPNRQASVLPYYQIISSVAVVQVLALCFTHANHNFSSEKSRLDTNLVHDVFCSCSPKVFCHSFDHRHVQVGTRPDLRLHSLLGKKTSARSS